MDMTKQECISEYEMEYEYIRDLLSRDPENDDLIDAMYDTIDLYKENGGKDNEVIQVQTALSEGKDYRG